jgi:nucleoside-diphosphate-sugar epimerase
MRILITGALGHIGSQLLRCLSMAEYDEILLIDNLATQRFPSLFDLPDGVPYRFVEADVLEADLARLVQGIDAVVHLAAATDAAGSFASREMVERVNFEGTRRVAQACAGEGCRLIFPSTTSVYGAQDQEVDEDCSPQQLKPQSPYAESKLRAEELLRLMGLRDGLRSVIVRFGTIFGTSPGMRFHTAINKFAWQACLGLPITVWRTAMNQKRPYLDLIDAVRAVEFLLARPRIHGLFNLVSANATVGQIVAILKDHIPGVSTVLVESPIMNQLSYEVSNARFRSLGFEFQGDLRQGILETIRLLRNANRYADRGGFSND